MDDGAVNLQERATQHQMPLNLLPYDGILWYHAGFVSAPDALMQQLLKEVRWQRDQVKMYGKLITTRREMAWYGDTDAVYRYSGVERHPLPWSEALLQWGKKVGIACDTTFNSCLVNLYHDGTEGMGWHRDNERELVPNAPIASLSLGALRRFDFRHRTTKERVSIQLEPGSLLVMEGVIQEKWEHQLPVARRIREPRINLTYRRISTDK